MKRTRQLDYSTIHSELYYDKENRIRKAQTIISILSDVSKDKLNNSIVLDVGASTGYIDNEIANHVKKIYGIDIDESAINFAKTKFNQDNLEFKLSDAMELGFKDESFDIVICNHIYEHVLDDQRLMDEILRVLKFGGYCLFTAGNRIALIEPHYKLPLLSVLPRIFSHIYLKITGKGSYYHEKHRCYWGLKSLVSKYKRVDYTLKIVIEPLRFKASYMIRPSSIKQMIAKIICKHIVWLCPTYIWVLKK